MAKDEFFCFLYLHFDVCKSDLFRGQHDCDTIAYHLKKTSKPGSKTLLRALFATLLSFTGCGRSSPQNPTDASSPPTAGTALSPPSPATAAAQATEQKQDSTINLNPNESKQRPLLSSDFNGTKPAEGTTLSQTASILLDGGPVPTVYQKRSLTLTFAVSGETNAGALDSNYSFECLRENEITFSPCKDGGSYHFVNLIDGAYSLTVRATAKSSDHPLTPVKVVFKVDLPSLIVNNADALASNNAAVTKLTWDQVQTEGLKVFCSLDDGDATDCTPGFELNRINLLSAGRHSLTVKTMDSSGRVVQSTTLSFEKPQKKANESENVADTTKNASTPSAVKPLDFGNMYYLGDGYDALSGQRKASCLDISSVILRQSPVNRTLDTIDIIGSHSDLIHHLNVEMNLEASGLVHAVTLSGSIKGDIIRETQLTEDSITLIASFTYFKNEISIYDSQPSLSANHMAELKQDNLLFRKQCGDKFTRSIKTGAVMYLVVKAQQTQQINSSKDQVQATFKAALGSLFGIGPSYTFSTEQKQILESLRLSSTCYAEGTSAKICAAQLLSAAQLNIHDNTLLDRVNAARKSLAEDIDGGKNLVALDEELESYDTPLSMGELPRSKLFFDYSFYLNNLQSWLDEEATVTTICDTVSYAQNECTAATKTIGNAAMSCAMQNLWSENNCSAPRDDEFRDILSLTNAGFVTMYKDGGRRGRSFTLNFSQLYGNDNSLKPYVVYNLDSYSFFHFADIMSSLDVNLEPGWQLVFYAERDGGGSTMIVDEGHRYQDALSFNDRAASFMLVRKLGSP